MTMRSGWEDGYFACIQTTGISTAGTFLATAHGFAGSTAGQCGLLLNSHPNLEIGHVNEFTEKTTGRSENSHDTGNAYEYHTGRGNPSVSLEMGLTPSRLIVFGWLCFQKGVSQDTGSTEDVTLVTPAKGGSECEVWASIGRAMGAGSAADGHAIHGAICSNLTIAGEAGGRVNLTAEMMGKTHVRNFDFTSADATFDSGGEALFTDFTYTLDATDVSNFMESFSISANNNASARFYGEVTPSSFVLQRFATSGNFKVAMSAGATEGDNVQLDNFANGTITPLTISKGSSGTAGYINIALNMIYTGGSVDPAEELMLDMPFDCVTNNDQSTRSIQIDTCDEVTPRGM